MPRIELEYFAQLSEATGQRTETRDTAALTAAALYDELRAQYGFVLPPGRMRLAVNTACRPWDQELREGGMVVFITPVTGG